MELLIGSMQIIVRKTKAHHERRNPELPHKISNDRDRSAAAHKDRLLAKDLAHRSGCSLHIRIVSRYDNRIARVNHPHRHLDAAWHNRIHISLVLGKGG